MDVFTIKLGEKVLFLGEGNFSFCVDFIKLNENIFVERLLDTSSEIIATCFESYDNLSERKRCNVNFLEEMGVTVLFSIDATRLQDYSSICCKRFTKIIFNFPHVGGKMKIHLNRKLLADFFVSSTDVLDKNGQILLTLCDGQGGTEADTVKRRWDDTWKVVDLAADAGLSLKSVHPFLLERFPGYVSTGFRSLEKGFNVDHALTHVFQVVECFVNPSEHEIQSLLCCEKITTSSGTDEVSRFHSTKLLLHPFMNEHSPQVSLYERIKKFKFHKDIKFYDDLDLVYGVSCMHKNLTDLFDTFLDLSLKNPGTVVVLKAFSLNELTGNFSQPPISCNIVCLGYESCKFTKQVISELLTSSYAECVSHMDSEIDEILYIDCENRIDILKISNLHSINNDMLSVCTVYLDNLTSYLFKINSWHELWAKGSRIRFYENTPKLYTPCLFPCTYTFDLSLATQENFTEQNFYKVLWHVAGNIIFDVKLISTYLSTNNKKHFCFRISYKSYEVPLSRRRVIDIQNKVIGRTLERLLDVTVL